MQRSDSDYLKLDRAIGYARYISFCGKLVDVIPEIETARLHLRMFTPADLNALASMLGEPDVARPLGLPPETSFSAILDKMIDLWKRDGIGRWAVVNKEDGNLIGLCGFRMLDGDPEIVCAFAKAYWKKGFATEACKASVRFALEARGFDRVVGVTKHTNLASLQLMKRFGMKDVNEQNPHGIDRVRYEIRRSDFRPDDSFYILTSHDEM